MGNLRNILSVDGQIVITFNTDKRFPPQPNLSACDKGPKLRQMHLPYFESNAFPYLCAVPAAPDYSGAILGQLNLTTEEFPIIKTASGFRLDPKLATSWLRLENLLSGIARILLESAQPSLPSEYRFPPYPHTLGYQDTFDSSLEATHAVQRSRDAFQPLIAHVAWAAILHRGIRYLSACKAQSRGNESKILAKVDLDEGWSDLLINKHKVHPAFVNELKVSAVCNFSIERAGVVVRNPKGWVFNDRIQSLVISSVPVWLIWGESPNHFPEETWTPELAHIFVPSAKELQSALRRTAKDTQVIENPMYGVKRIVETKIDRPENLKGTKNGGPDVHEWINRRKAMIKEAILSADEDKRAEWQQRQIGSERNQCPTKDGPLVYEWKRDQNHFPVRIRVGSSKVAQTWTLFGDRQRWFNCALNEWELCSELDPSDTPQSVEPELSSVEQAQDEVIEGWLPLQELEEQVNVAMLSRLNAFQLEADEIVVNTPTETQVSKIGLDAYPLLSTRFGFSYTPGEKYASISKVPIKLEKAIRIVGGRLVQQESEPSTIPSGLEASFIQYTMFLDAIGRTAEEGSELELPPAICDLYPENRRFLGKLPSPIRIRPVQAEDKIFYFLNHELDECLAWQLAVTDPCTALHAVRLKPSSIAELTREFIRCRTPFFTFKISGEDREGSNLGLPGLRKCSGIRIGLGVRPLGHVFNNTDYVAYEAVQKRLLTNQRIAWAAIKRGGILSRLASGLVDEEDVLDGPSGIANDHPVQIKVKKNGCSLTYYDDGISEEEIATFVGLYSNQGSKSVSCARWLTFILIQDP